MQEVKSIKEEPSQVSDGSFIMRKTPIFRFLVVFEAKI